MTNQEYVAYIKGIFERCAAIVEKKNADYSGVSDAMKNFKLWESFDISMETGILVQIIQKTSRIKNLLTQEAQVKEESIEDSILDLINYAAILATIRHYKTRTAPLPLQPLVEPTETLRP